jgi:hypothetical protein
LEFVEQLFNCLTIDVNKSCNKPSELISTLSAAVIADISSMEGGEDDANCRIEVLCVRFFVSAASLRHAITNGKPSIAFNWLLCSITYRAYQDVETGSQIEATQWYLRPRSFLISDNHVIQEFCSQAVVRWIGDIYYSAHKFSLHHDLARLMLPEARQIVSAVMLANDGDLIEDAVYACAQLASWLNQTKEIETKDIAQLLARVYSRPDLSASCRKLAGVALATEIGNNLDEGSQVWASRTFNDFREHLVQHEECQLLGSICVTLDELQARHKEILAAYEKYSESVADNYRSDSAGATFRRAQLFEIIGPVIRKLISFGKCREAIELVAAWFGVPSDRRRTSPVLAFVPIENGIIYAVDGHAEIHEHDSEQFHRNLIDAINFGFDTSIAIRHDRQLPPVITGRRAPAIRNGFDNLRAATGNYYELEFLRGFLKRTPTTPLGCFHPIADKTPFQSQTEVELGATWPIVTSFREPQKDRPVNKVLLWSCGTILGAYEIGSISAFFKAHGIECVARTEENISKKQFLEFYADESFDAIWISAHGEFDSRAPHLACINLSVDGHQKVTVSDLLSCSIPENDRRLLFLNICLGGATSAAVAPACLGLGAMLANESQAVVSHMAEVGTFVAPLFGTLMAIGMLNNPTFFSAFRYAIRHLPMEHQAVLDLIQNEAPQCAGIHQRLKNSSPGVDANDIRTWGTPVFFE